MADDENKLIDQQNRGAAADMELRLTADAFVELRGAYVKAWENSDPRDTAGREKLWVAMTVLSKVEGSLRQFVNDGKVAAKELERRQKAAEEKVRRSGERVRRFGIV